MGDVPFRAEREREERSAHVCHDATDDELLLSCGAHRGAEVGAVPSTVAQADILAFLKNAYNKLWLIEPEGTYFTSPFRCTTSTPGYISVISFGKGPFGPVSADVVITTGILNSLPRDAWASMLSLKTVGSISRVMP